MNLRRFTVVMALVSVWLAQLSATTSEALAEEPARAEPALLAAKAEFEEAQTLYLREKYAEAAAKFLSAYEHKPFAAFLFNAAVAHEKDNKLEQAVQLFEKYLAKDPQAADGKDVKARIESLKAILNPPPPPPPPAPPVPGAPPTAPPPPVVAKVTPAVLPAISTKGLVIIDSKPAGASIYLNDKKKGVFAVTPWQGSLEPKDVKIIVEAKGFKPEERTISPKTDKVYDMYIALSEEYFLGWVEIVSNVPNADVYIDKRETGVAGKTPYKGYINPGKHTFWVEKPGYLVARKEVDVQRGTSATHTVPLEKVDNGWVTVVGKQSKGGSLKVDEKVACATPCTHATTPGVHRIEVERPDMERYRGDITVERSIETTIDVHFSPKPPRSKAWTSAVVSALFVGGGTYLGLKANGLKNDLQSDSNKGQVLVDNSDPRVQRGKYYAIGADVLFTLGALTGIIALINFVSSGPDSTADVDTRAIGLAPTGGPDGLGLLARGRF